MVSSMIYSFNTRYDKDSQAALDDYLQREGFAIAHRDDVPADEFEALARTRPNKQVQGCYALYPISDEPGAPCAMHHFLDGSRKAFAFAEEGVLPAGATLWVRSVR